MPDVFCAIDFETADPGRDSACAVGLVRVENWELVYQEAVLIRPPREKFTFTHIHGITWSRVKGEPTFAGVWPKLVPILDGAARLVAHNAPFDRSVLENCCEAAGLKRPKLPWVCTLALAKQRWPGRSNKLPDVVARLGIAMGQHHDARDDAEACARILVAMEKPAVVKRPVGDPGPVLAILATIPPEHRTPAVERLIADAVVLGSVEWAAKLVGLVKEWFERPAQGVVVCGCGKATTWLSGVCRTCADREEQCVQA